MQNYGIVVRAKLATAGLATIGFYGLLVAWARIFDTHDPSDALPDNQFALVLLLVLPGALFVFWLLAARERIRAAGIRLTWTTFWSVVIWMIPYANLIGSLHLMAEIDRAAQRIRVPANNDEWFRLWAILWTTRSRAGSWLMSFVRIPA